MTPRIQMNRDKQRCERRDHRLNKSQRDQNKTQMSRPKTGRRTGAGSYSREDSVILGHNESKPAHQWQKLKDIKLREVKLKADQQRKSMHLRRS
ncbi:hypothetical protein Bca52824_088917 [Brassica carinata]|uniref:Uncharacterized protein n=1 Tax=Brassica carinata TaxID=52824 RepID=A0A8X7PB52_BRACI|nr:hypothetical protein Bca52824_088917 [Brassica carinata]